MLNNIDKINNASNSNMLCYFYTIDERSCFVPVSVEVSKQTEKNLIVGYNANDKQAFVLPLSYVKKIVVTDISQRITKEICNFIFDVLDEYYEEMEK